MNSSTSSSETPARWRGFAAALLLTGAALTGLLLALACLLDPYDTGRTPLSLAPGLRPQAPRMATASRGRDPAFNAAILGNSHIQLLEPAALTASTGIRFLSLATPGIGPGEALAQLDWLLRHRRQPAQALVVGIDQYWCTSDAALPHDRPFPFWLIDRSFVAYLVGLLRFDVLEELPRRIAWLIETDPARARPDGYWDYAGDYEAQGPAGNRARREQMAMFQQRGGGNATGPFPAADALERRLASSPETALVLLRPPVYATALSQPGTPDAAADAACRGAFAALAARRPRTLLLDWRIDRAETRDPDLFYDHTHYRHGLARKVEADIAGAIDKIGARQTDRQ